MDGDLTIKKETTTYTYIYNVYIHHSVLYGTAISCYSFYSFTAAVDLFTFLGVSTLYSLMTTVCRARRSTFFSLLSVANAVIHSNHELTASLISFLFLPLYFSFIFSRTRFIYVLSWWWLALASSLSLFSSFSFLLVFSAAEFLMIFFSQLDSFSYFWTIQSWLTTIMTLFGCVYLPIVGIIISFEIACCRPTFKAASLRKCTESPLNIRFQFQWKMEYPASIVFFI